MLHPEESEAILSDIQEFLQGHPPETDGEALTELHGLLKEGTDRLGKIAAECKDLKVCIYICIPHKPCNAAYLRPVCFKRIDLDLCAMSFLSQYFFFFFLHAYVHAKWREKEKHKRKLCIYILGIQHAYA